MKKAFQAMAEKHKAKGYESVSGKGSSMKSTTITRKFIERVIAEYRVSSILDVGCGDCNWVRQLLGVKHIVYKGIDVVPEIIEHNKTMAHLLPFKEVEFKVMDITKQIPDSATLVICRDVLMHLSDEDVLKAYRNIYWSESLLFIATTFPEHQNDKDIVAGQFRPINLETMLTLNPRLSIENEKRPRKDKHGDHSDKSIALWSLNQ